MKLYIDKENLRSLVHSQKDSDFAECVRLIVKNMDVQYNFSKSKEDIVHDPDLSFWFRQYGDSGTSTTFCPPASIIPDRPLKSNYFTGKGIDLLSSVYLINDVNVPVIQSKRSVLIGNVGEEIQTIKLLLIDSSSKPSALIHSWETFCPELPMTDVILCDNHYFKHKEVYEKNDNELIRFLASIPKAPLHIIIITKTGEIDPAINLSQEQKNIRDIVVKGTGSQKSSVVIATTYKDHGRNLISNYFRIDHGTCFHLKGNNIKGNDVTSRKSNAVLGEEETTKYLINFFQDVIDNCNEKYGNYNGNLLRIKNKK